MILPHLSLPQETLLDCFSLLIRTSITPGPASLLAATSRLVREGHSDRGVTEAASCKAFLERLRVWRAGRHESPAAVSMQFWLMSSCAMQNKAESNSGQTVTNARNERGRPVASVGSDTSGHFFISTPPTKLHVAAASKA